MVQGETKREKKNKKNKTIAGLLMGIGLMLVVQVIIAEPSINKIIKEDAVEKNKARPMMENDKKWYDSNAVAMVGNTVQYSYATAKIKK
ncbi:hypothetical protein SAMN06265379_10973 [Saccharicrinis carchari]|uniref:Uncharacterized protein n=1 Tax=Saccharicrinis carchari TaxID=1168039 RepID=A0A521EK68_SACCC|nr:hypothetical protein [Saccharicrinis carchari]SMO84306.1 hypothetical protein SAMN06265379_10973 [Saccharicrinis carchari]